MEQQWTKTRANTPWGLWTAAGGPTKDVIVSQAIITSIFEENRRTQLDKDIMQRDHTDFGRKAWIQSDKIKQRVGDDVPEGTQHTHRKVDSGEIGRAHV
jgi:hypothetical protein